MAAGPSADDAAPERGIQFKQVAGPPRYERPVSGLEQRLQDSEVVFEVVDGSRRIAGAGHARLALATSAASAASAR